GNRHDKDIEIAVIFSSECNLVPVRRENRMSLQPGAGGQAACTAAGSVDDPKVAGMAKGDLCGAYCRMIGKLLWTFSPNYARECQERYEHKTKPVHDLPSMIC